MRTELCDLFGIDVPIFAFSHCRDVVAAEGWDRGLHRVPGEGLSDEVTEALYNSDRVLHMVQGRIAGEYDPSTTSVQALEEAIYE